MHESQHLANYEVMDTGSEPEFDLVTEMAAELFGARTAMICFADSKRLWIKSAFGTDQNEIARDNSLCDHVLRSRVPLTVCDLLTDPRFQGEVSGTHAADFRFYVGVPLVNDEGVALGTLLVIDTDPRPEPPPAQIHGLERLAQLVMHQLNHRKTRIELHRISERAQRMEAIQAAIAAASTCEQALTGLLAQLCRWHRATAGRIWKVFHGGEMMLGVSHFHSDQPEASQYYTQSRHVVVTVDNSNTAAAIRSNRPLTLRYRDLKDPENYPLVPVAMAAGLMCQVSYPIWVEGERFGVAMAFSEDRSDLADIIADIASLEDLIRPALQRKVTEERQLLLGQALDRASDGVLIAEVLPGRPGTPRIIYANGGLCQMTGYGLDEVIGQTPLLLQGPETDKAALADMIAGMDAGRPSRAELQFYRKDGGTLWIDIEFAPVVGESDAYTHWVAILRDITQRRIEEATLLRSEKLKTIGQLTGGIAHDFNNLLTVVTLNLEEVINKLPLYDPLLNLLQPAMHASLRGAELTAQLVSYARRAPLRPQPMRMKTVLSGLQPLLKRALGEQYELSVQIQPDDIIANADPAQLENALMNLLINSRDAMPRGGVIGLDITEIELAPGNPDLHEDMQPGRYARISVVDSGDGIRPEVLARVFDPFFTTKEVGKGTGLGLSMVYGFARQSGGHIALRSQPGRGTQAILHLPAIRDLS